MSASGEQHSGNWPCAARVPPVSVFRSAGGGSRGDDGGVVENRVYERKSGKWEEWVWETQGGGRKWHIKSQSLRDKNLKWAKLKEMNVWRESETSPLCTAFVHYPANQIDVVSELIPAFPRDKGEVKWSGLSWQKQRRKWSCVGDKQLVWLLQAKIVFSCNKWKWSFHFW